MMVERKEKVFIGGPEMFSRNFIDMQLSSRFDLNITALAKWISLSHSTKRNMLLEWK